MFLSQRYPAIVFLSVIVGFSLLGCVDTMAYQCNEVISIANDTVTQAKELTEAGKTTDPQAMLQAADAMEASAVQMEAVEVEDEQIQAYQTGFIEMYQKTAASTRSFVTAYENSDRDSAENSFSHLQEATGAEEELVQGINQYCRQS